MHPVLIQIGNFTIGTYGLMIVIGMLTGLALATRLSRRRGIPPEFFFDLAFVLLLTGFIGARIFHILLNWGEFVQAPLAMIFSRQGFVFLGGFISALIAGIYFAHRRKVPLMEAADIAAPGLVLAHAFGRIGCFLAGCCFGMACPADGGHPALAHLAVQYPLITDNAGMPSYMFNFAYWTQLQQHLIGPGAAAPLPILPVQLFESAGNFIICGLLLILWRRRTFSGQIFALYLALYSVLRFSLEFLRGDVERGLWFGGHISTSQITTIFTMIAAVALWLTRHKKGISPLPVFESEEETEPEITTGNATARKTRKSRRKK
jgi:phosphatidylglycerol:prolipoprotein diacylglycerol transferase